MDTDESEPVRPGSGLVTRYGADAAGMISGYRLAPAHVESIGSDAAARLLANGSPTDSFVWLHFDLGHTGTRAWLDAHAALPAEFGQLLDAGIASTRVERAEQTLIAVVNDLRFDFAFDPSDIATLWIAVGRDRVITARRAPLRSVDRLRQALRDGLRLRSPSQLLEELLRAQADTLVEIVREATERVDRIEDDLLAQRLQRRRNRLGTLRRLLVRLQRLLAPEPAALFRLLQHPPAWISREDAQELRGATEEFAVVLSDMVSLQERIKLLQEEIAAEVAEANNRSLFVLTIVTVLALPINLVAGLLGMNVGGIPLAQHPHGFWIVLLTIAAITAPAAVIAMRLARREP